jgi:hypothetical protein
MKHDNCFANYMAGQTLMVVEHTQTASAMYFNKTEM